MDSTAMPREDWPELHRARRAIVVVDVVESVRLMQEHEADFIDRWRRFVNLAAQHVVPRLGGRLVKSLGDGMLLEFGSAASALAAANELLEAVATLNAGREAPALIQLRVGLHVADVVVDQLDIYGSGVNLAARLAAVAMPGQVVASQEVRDEIAPGVHAHVVDLGEVYLKHIEHPVRAYRLDASPAPAGIAPVPPGTPMKPLVAVVPFDGHDAEPSLRALGHAFTDEINAAFSRSRDVRVVSRLSTAGLATTGWRPAAVAERLGVSYVVSGAYAVLGGRARLHIELCDARDDTVCWARSATLSIEDFFRGQDPVLPEVIAALGREIVAAELRRVGSLPMPSLASYTLYLGGVGLLHRLSRRDFERSRELLQFLAERQPRAAAPHAMLSKWHMLRIVQGWAESADDEARQARAAARRALDLDDQEAFALTAEGMVSVLIDKDLDSGAGWYARALEANPHEPYAWALQSGLQSYRDDHEAACRSAATALSLSPLDPARFLFEAYAAMAHLGGGDADTAATLAQRSLEHNALHTPSLRILVIAQMLRGQADEARRAAARLMSLEPGLRVGDYVRRFPGRESPNLRRYAEALAAAGVPQ